MEDLLTAAELAERLRLRTCTIQAWTREGLIPSIRITGKVIRYDYEDVRRTLKKTKANPRDGGDADGHR